MRQLLDRVLLVAAAVGVQHDVLRRAVPVIGDVEEAAAVVEQLELPLVHFQILPDDDHAVFVLTQRGRILELGHVLPRQPDVLKLAPNDDLLLDVLRPSPRLRFDRIFRRPLQPFPGGFR